MRVLYLNPNSTQAMTDSLLAAARAANPEVEIDGLTNPDGPPAIEGPEHGRMVVPQLLAMLRGLRADAIVIGCFDDTGLAELRAASPVPVIGIGQAAYMTAAMLGHRFGVVTTLPVSVPVIEANIAALGLAGGCSGVRASGLPVLVVEEGSGATRAHLAAEIRASRDRDGASAVVLGCAGMAALAADLGGLSGVPVIDGVAAAAHLAPALARFTRR